MLYSEPVDDDTEDGDTTLAPLSTTISKFARFKSYRPGWWRRGTIRVYPEWLESWAKRAAEMEAQLKPWKEKVNVCRAGVLVMRDMLTDAQQWEQGRREHLLAMLDKMDQELRHGD